MNYKLFEEYITLQALFKKLSIIQSGGNIKSFLQETTVLFNGEDEKRRGKKLRIGDKISLPESNLIIDIVAPNDEEIKQYQIDLEEKQAVAKRVKELNKNIKKQTKSSTKKPSHPKQAKKTIKFPGT